MAFNTTPDSEDWDYFYYTNHPQPLRTMEQPFEILQYHIMTFADISSSRNIHRCIGKNGNGLLAEQCKATLAHNTHLATHPISKSAVETGNVWTEAKHLVKLARSCLCEECCDTQLSDVVVAWVEELENPLHRTVRRADSVIDEEAVGAVSRVVEMASVKSLVAASVATRDLVSKVWGLWS